MDTLLCRSLSEASRYNHEGFMQKFISEGEDPNATDIFGLGWTPLQWVTHCGYDTCLKMLIDAGVNIAATDEFGRTPLHWAVGSHHSGCVQTLIDAGSGPNIADNRGETPLHEAACVGHDACIQTLVESGANPNITEGPRCTMLLITIVKNAFKNLLTLGLHQMYPIKKEKRRFKLRSEKITKNAQR